MANVPKNRNVKEFKDVQNVITSVILRQKGKFSKENIYEGVESNIKFSTFGKYGKKRATIDVKKLVDNTLDTMWSIDAVRYFSEEGKYKLSMNFPSI